MTSAPSKRRAGIQSVGIGLRVLDALAAGGEPQPLGAIASASGLSSSQAHRYLASLVGAGMARQDPGTGRYDLGPSALRLGLGALARVDAFNAAHVALSAFVRETGRTVQIAALGPTGPVVVRWLMGFPPVATSLTVGSTLPLLRSATGHVFLAFRSEAQTRELVERESRASRGLEPVSVDVIRRRVREDGFASVSGSVIPGLRATAMPIFDFQQEAVLSATVLATDAFRPNADPAIRAALGDVCDEVTRAIGGRRPTA
jgi:DNA-binding IclR family transcriptional regulator